MTAIGKKSAPAPRTASQRASLRAPGAQPPHRRAAATPTPVEAAQVPAAGREPHAALPGEVAAVVGGKLLTAARLDAEALELGLFDALPSALEALAASLGVPAPTDDRPERWLAFQQELQVAAARAQRTEEVQHALSEAVDAARGRALQQRVGAAELPSALKGRGIVVPPEARDDLGAQQALLLAALAAERGVSPDSEEAAAAFNAWLNERVDAALWAPHARRAERALAAVPPKDRAARLRTLFDLYTPALGLAAYAQVAHELAEGGAARDLWALFEAAPGPLWSRDQLERLSRERPALAWLREQLPPPRTGDGQPCPLALAIDSGGLRLQELESPALAELRSGARTVSWGRGADGQPWAEVLRKQGDSAADEQLVAWMGPQLTRQAQKAAETLAKAGERVPSLSQLAEAHGLTALLGSKAVETLAAFPPVKVALTRLALQRAVAQLAPEQHAALLDAQDVPGPLRTELTRTFDRARALQAAHPLPPELAVALRPGGPGDEVLVELPLQENAPLSASQERALAAVQHYLVAAKEVPEGSLTPGVLDRNTVTKLRELFQSAQRQAPSDAAPPSEPTLTLTRSMVDTFLRLASAKAGAENRLLGELVLAHPVAELARSETPPTDPVQLVLAYLQETGQPPLPTGSPTAPKERAAPSWSAFAEGLAQSARLPVDAAALRRARASALAQPPLSSDARHRLLETPLLLGGPSGQRVALPGQPASPQDAAAAAARLYPLSLPQLARRYARADEGVVALELGGARAGRPGLDALPAREPIAALKLFVARLQRRPPPVDGQGVLRAVLEADELEALAGLLTQQPAATTEAFKRVAGYLRTGQVVLSTLDDVPGDAPVARDVQRVVESLRQMAHLLSYLTVPQDAATLAGLDPLAAFEPIAKSADRVAEARRALASHFSEPLPNGGSPSHLTGDDLRRLQRFATELRGAPLDGTHTETARQQLLAASDGLAGDVEACAQALESGRLELSRDGARTTPRDEALELQAGRVRGHLLEAGELARTLARERHERNPAATAARAASTASQFLFRLNFLADGDLLNHVTDWSLTALRAEMHAKAPERFPDASLPAPLRQARSRIDRSVVDFLIQSGGDGDGALSALAAALESGQLEPWDPRRYPRHPAGTELAPELGAGRREVKDGTEPRLARWMEAAMARVDAAFDKELAARARIRPELLRSLAEHHADALGKSSLATLTTGTPVPLPGPDEARALLLEVADQLPPEGWDSLNLSLSDLSTDATRFRRNVLAKLVVQSALDRLSTTSTQGLAGLLSGRSRAALAQLAELLFGLPQEKLAPFLKGHLLQHGYSSAEEVSDLRSPLFGPVLLRQAARLAESCVHLFRKAEPEEARALEEAARTLEEAAARGETVSMALGAADTPALRALRRVAAYGTAAKGRLASVGETPLLSFASLLPGVERLEVRSPTENVVHEAPPRLALSELADRLGRKAPPGAGTRKWTKDWMDRAHFTPGRFLETAGASHLLFWNQLGLMAAMVHQQVYAKPLLQTVQAAGEARAAQTRAERSAALEEAGRAWQEALHLSLMATAFRTVVGPLEDVADQLAKGNVDVAAGRAYAFYATMPALAAGTFHFLRNGWGAVRRGAGQLNEHLTGRPAQRLVPLGQQLVAASVESVSQGPQVSTARTLAARAYQLAAGAADVARNPKRGWQLAGAGLGWSTRALKPHRRLVPGAAPFELTLSAQDREFLQAHPQDGRFRLSLGEFQGRGVPTLQPTAELWIPNQALLELADQVSRHPGQPLPAPLAAALGLDAFPPATARALAGALAHMVEGLEAAPANAPAPKRLAELVSSGQVTDELTWKVASPGGQAQPLVLRNSRLAALAEVLGDSLALDPTGAQFAAELARDFPELAGYAPEQVRAVVEGLAHEADGWGPARKQRQRFTTRGAQVAALGTALPALETALPPPADVATAELNRALYDGQLVRLVRGASSPPDAGALDEAGRDVSSTPAGERALGRLADVQRRFGLGQRLDLAGQLMRVEAERAAFSRELEALRKEAAKAPAAKTQRAAELYERYEQWHRHTEQRLGAVRPEEQSSWHARLRLPQLRLAMATQTLRLALEANQLGTATLELARRGGTQLLEGAKGPDFRLVLLLQGKELAFELGDIWGPAPAAPEGDALSKGWQTGMALAGAAAKAGVATGAVAALSQLMPKVGRAATGLGGLSLLAEDGPDNLLSWVPDALGRFSGRMNLLDAVSTWQRLGLPEAVYLRTKPAYPASGEIYYRGLDDVSALAHNSQWTRRMHLWLGPQSSVHHRLRQLSALGAEAFTRPLEFQPALPPGQSYWEPPFPTFVFLMRLPELRQQLPERYLVQSTQGFEPKAFLLKVRDACERTLLRPVLTTDETGAAVDSGLFVLEPDALAELLASFDAPPAEKGTRDGARIAAEVESAQKWLATLHRAGVPAEQRRAAVEQLVANLAATHLVNRVMLDSSEKARHGEPVPWAKGVDLSDDAYLGLLNVP